MHTKKKPYPCPVCNMSFTAPGNRSDHLKRHFKHRPYICTVSRHCHIRYYRKGQLLDHIRRDHQNVRLTNRLVDSIKPHRINYAGIIKL